MDWTTIILLTAAVIYLTIGLVLTRSLRGSAPSLRIRFNDYLVGTLTMPILTLMVIIFTLIEDLWFRLLIALDYEPEER